MHSTLPPSPIFIPPASVTLLASPSLTVSSIIRASWPARAPIADPIAALRKEPEFCFDCGLIGHSIRECPSSSEGPLPEPLKDHKFGA
ncbi:hypothetical protein ACOSQ4_028896 [Xanthoceras sorbifolium]